MQVMSLLPDRLYPGLQSTSTCVPRFTGSEVTVIRLKLKLLGGLVHCSVNMKSLCQFEVGWSSLFGEWRFSLIMGRTILKLSISLHGWSKRHRNFHSPIIHMGSCLREIYSASCTQVINLSPEVRVKPSAQSTNISVPFFTGNTESVLRCPPVGNSVQVPAILFFFLGSKLYQFSSKFNRYYRYW